MSLIWFVLFFSAYLAAVEALSPTSYTLLLLENSTDDQAPDYDSLVDVFDPLVSDDRIVMNRSSIGYLLPDYRTTTPCSRGSKQQGKCGINNMPKSVLFMEKKKKNNLLNRVSKILDDYNATYVKKSQLFVFVNAECGSVKTEDLYPDLFDFFNSNLTTTLKMIEDNQLHTYIYWNRIDNTDGACKKVKAINSTFAAVYDFSWDTKEFKDKVKSTFFEEWKVTKGSGRSSDNGSNTIVFASISAYLLSWTVKTT